MTRSDHRMSACFLHSMHRTIHTIDLHCLQRMHLLLHPNSPQCIRWHYRKRRINHQFIRRDHLFVIKELQSVP
jgi:hypothetical protein